MNGNPTFQLHALEIANGKEMPNSPVTIQASTSGSGYDSQGGIITFNSDSQLQRTALLLVNGVVYMGFASYGDTDPYHGWILGYNAATLQQVAVLNAAPDQRGSIWQSGGGLAADSNGFIYAVTGNGTWDGVVNFGESILKLNPSGGLSVADWFTPDNLHDLNVSDLDLGSGRPLLIPGTNFLVSGGKQGLLYVVDRTNMGHLVPGNSQIVQIFGNPGPEIYSGLAYWNNSSDPLLYVWGGNDVLTASGSAAVCLGPRRYPEARSQRPTVLV